MAFLEQFSAAEKSLIVALPYRAGLWVSQSDQTGGRRADALEHQALGRIIEGRVKGGFKSTFVHEVMKEVFARRGDWAGWASVLDRVPDECREAVALLQPRLMATDMTAYRHGIMSIARDVAMAYREHDESVSTMARLMTDLRIGTDKLIGMIRGEAYMSEALLNISEKEDMALGALAAGLKTLDITPHSS